MMGPSGSELQTTPRPAPRWAPTVVDRSRHMPWGWLDRGTGPGLMSMVPETRMGTNTIRHYDVPRFGALHRDNTPSPADLTMSNNSGYNECSLSCLRGGEEGLWSQFSPGS